ncbi:peptidoglycan-binding protein LysM [Corallococcus praedator]|uniref:Peptidoglycan-binding protein LysM n=1 Tax=Corallococcus praedator TaxID=2316724 RepID=A0ABX9Q6D4_9BACT|nr:MULTISPECIES: peptidoglycan-binding protein LysM [Corallococcus]RKH09886.1 peptidoglycan-binding protein LysM [Corallococcus sp. CA047B]RKH25173.1 peptidoglycan-binding protein LysM [Corallococcus sp. CA031C]RKH92602.1 peptidoglycan-binding protein LysM [Corallococcus praedator]
MKAALWLSAWMGLSVVPSAPTVVGHEPPEAPARRGSGGSGATPKAPSAEPQTALKALEMSRAAVKAAPNDARRREAEDRLKDAEAHFQQARYADALHKADEAWALLNPPQPSLFTVEVGHDGGTTTVTHRQGPPVTVEAQHATRILAKGESVRVQQGTVLPEPPSAPQPVQPTDKYRFTLKPSAQGLLGPVTLSWAAVEGATRYEVEVVPETVEAGPLPSPVREVLGARQWALPALPAGRYRWTVTAVSPGQGRSVPSTARRFELAADALELNIKVKDGWQK